MQLDYATYATRSTAIIKRRKISYQNRINPSIIINFSSCYRLTHLFPMHPSLPPENIRKPYGFLVFSGDTGKLHWNKWVNEKAA